MRKIISSLSFLLFILFVCCSPYEHITLKPDEYVDYEKTEGKPNEIYVITNDSLKYHFESWMFNIKDDSMYAEGPQIVNGTEVQFQGYIPLQNIATIEWTEQTNYSTYSAWGLMIILPVLMVLFVALASYAN